MRFGGRPLRGSPRTRGTRTPLPWTGHPPRHCLVFDVLNVSGEFSHKGQMPGLAGQPVGGTSQGERQGLVVRKDGEWPPLQDVAVVPGGYSPNPRLPALQKF